MRTEILSGAVPLLTLPLFLLIHSLTSVFLLSLYFPYRMGASASSMSTELFAELKTEYEAKVQQGLSDEELFNHMKALIEEKTAAGAAAPAAAPASEEVTVGTAQEAPIEAAGEEVFNAHIPYHLNV